MGNRRWTTEDSIKLAKLFYAGKSYNEMAKALNRTWFACKCRLARLKLIEPFPYNGDEHYIGNDEKFTHPFFNEHPLGQPNSFEDLIDLCKSKDSIFGIMGLTDDEEEEDTSRTFSVMELNVVTDFLKTRLARVVTLLADGPDCFVKNVELNTVKELLETEIQVANSMKKMTVAEREEVCKRL